MFRQELGHGQGIGAVPIHAERQGLNPVQGKESIHRGHGWPQIAQADGMAMDGVGHVAEGLVKAQAVIGGFGFGQAREVLVGGPIELPAIDHAAPHRGAMAADEFRGGVDGDRRPPLEGAAEVRGRHGIVDDQRDPCAGRDGGDRFKITDHTAWIGQAFAEQGLGAIGDRRAKILRLVAIDEGNVPADLLEGHA